MKYLACVIAILAMCTTGLFANNLQQGDQAIAFDVAWSKSGGESNTDMSGIWYYYTGNNMRTGANLLFVDEGDMSGGGAGPSYDYLFRPMSNEQNWRIVVGGDVAFLTGDLESAASGVAITRIGVEWSLSGGTAIRLMPRWIHPVNTNDPALADEVEQYGFTVGILLGLARDQTTP
jgi:hypothetical protein